MLATALTINFKSLAISMSYPSLSTLNLPAKADGVTAYLPNDHCRVPVENCDSEVTLETGKNEFACRVQEDQEPGLYNCYSLAEELRQPGRRALDETTTVEGTF
jgi:hypothetical protein